MTDCTCMWYGRVICEQWGEEWRAGMASGAQGSRGATLPADCMLNPCWLLHWCSHCSDLSSLPPRPLKTKEHHPKPDVSPDKSSLRSGPEIFKVNERVMSQWVTLRRSRADIKQRRWRGVSACRTFRVWFQFGHVDEYCMLWIDWLLRELLLFTIFNLSHHLSRCYRLAATVCVRFITCMSNQG